MASQVVRVFRLETSANANFGTERRADRHLVRAVGAWEISLIGQVLNIQLNPEIVRDIIKRCSIKPRVRWQGRMRVGIADIEISDERLVLVGRAEA